MAATKAKQPAPLAFKPDLEAAAERWNAYFESAIVDRPLVIVTAPKEGKKAGLWVTYRDRVFGDMDRIIDHALKWFVRNT